MQIISRFLCRSPQAFNAKMESMQHRPLFGDVGLKLPKLFRHICAHVPPGSHNMDEYSNYFSQRNPKCARADATEIPWFGCPATGADRDVHIVKFELLQTLYLSSLP
jgi:hypothetical protein